jgi:hypothetical protein
MNRRSFVAARITRKAVWGGELGRVTGLAAVLSLTVLSAACGDLTRQGTASSYLIINSLQATSGTTGTPGTTLQSDVRSDDGTIFSDSGVVVLQLAMKDPTSTTGPTTANIITINRYRVRFTRADGRNTPGVDVPYGFDGAVTATVATSTSIPFELVRHVAKLEAPLEALARNLVIISTIAEITFYGNDQTGREVSVTGQMLVSFGNFAG